MTWKPLPGRVIVTREQQLTSKVLHIIATDERGARLADRGKVLAVGEPPPSHRYDTDAIHTGDDVFYLGPAEKLAIEWFGECAPCMGTGKKDADAERDDCDLCDGEGRRMQKAYAVSYDEVLGVVEP